MARAVIIWISTLTALSCTHPVERRGLHFTTLSSSVTGVGFENKITENDSLNMFVNEYTYMGGGVGIGDFNRDGLPDIFFSGNQVSCRLYLNRGEMHFEDITAKAGVTTAAWCTGVSVVDINNDGWPDIYVCASGKVPGARRRHLLFINQHDLTFKEEAAEYGLADTSYSTQAVFFDYDKDGRLDMYLVNHTLDDNRPNDIRDRKIDSSAIAADKLYHNEGIPPGMDHPVFKDVSKAAGIIEDGNGLGVVAADFNGDGYPDLYVTNDYIRNDLLWLNDKHGGFTNCIASSLRHQSYSSMGIDAADLNNDGLPDIITLDMQPETNERKKMMYSFLSEQRHQLEMDKGYEPQYVRNMLQLNNGNRQVNGRSEPFFSEIGEMAGIAETDWSWSVLIADFDNDGRKDVHITNGLGRDPTNIDFLEYAHNTVLQTGIPENELGQRRKFMDRLSSLGPLSLRSYLYRNNGDFSFEDISSAAGIEETAISNGAAYADLDNDGDLDLVINNINGKAFIRRNDTPKSDTRKSDAPKSGYLTIRLIGDSLNRDGFGARVQAYSKGLAQTVEQFPVRGYLSTVDNRLHIGLGAGTLDSVTIVWPDGKKQALPHPPADTILTLNYSDATAARQPASSQGASPEPAAGNIPAAGDTHNDKPPGARQPAARQPGARQPAVRQPATRQPAASRSAALFEDATQRLATDFRHRETFFFDYQFQPLLPQKYSQEGPFISTGDLDGDGREDFFIGGAFKQSGRIFLQNRDGSFTGKDLVKGLKYEEDMQSIMFDADGDKDLDLLIVGGSSEFDDRSSYYRPRLYLNDGRGNFHQDSMAFSPLVRTLAKSVAIADIDGDGDMDIFVGGRLSLGAYPRSPESYILRNDHGRFTDVTDTVAPALRNAGMINAACWADINGDGRPDLILAGDWMPIRIFINDGRTLTETTSQSGLGGSSGFWRSLLITDIDHDGRPDIVAGNIGLNNPFHINAAQPARLVAKDLDGNGSIDPVFCYYIRGGDGKYGLSVGISRDDWARQVPSVKKKYESNASYAKAGMDDLFTPEMMTGALVLDCSETRSGYFANDGKGGFHFHPFPPMAQMAPVNAMVCTDVDGDGIADLILAGNDYEASVVSGRYDASYGLLLKGDGRGGFTPAPPVAAGLILDGDARDLKLIRTTGGRVLLAAINDQPLKAFRLTTP